jgi:hypothetical protein
MLETRPQRQSDHTAREGSSTVRYHNVWWTGRDGTGRDGTGRATVLEESSVAGFVERLFTAGWQSMEVVTSDGRPVGGIGVVGLRLWWAEVGDSEVMGR